MADKVKPLKIESPATGGTEIDMFPTEVNPSEDYIALKGLAFENSDSYLLDTAADGQIQYKDSKQVSYRKLNEIYNFSYHKIEEDKTVQIPLDQHMLCANLEVDGFLDIEGSLYFI